MRILLVDADTSSRTRLRIALREGLGVEVVECVDGATALEHVRRQSFELVVSELQLPLMSGIDMLTILRAQPTLAKLPVMVVTDRRDAGLVRRVIGLGVGDYLVKPIDPARLCARASALMNRTSAALEANPLATVMTDALPRAGRVLLPPLP